VVPLWCREGATCSHALDSRHCSYAAAAVHLFPMPLSPPHATHYDLLAPLLMLAWYPRSRHCCPCTAGEAYSLQSIV
jgi:hypothetical protein